MLENNRNSTVSARAFSGTSSWGGRTIEGQAIQGNMELNHMYQLKIGNYETFIMNQTGPVQFNIQDTNRSLGIDRRSILSLAGPLRSSKPQHNDYLHKRAQSLLVCRPCCPRCNTPVIELQLLGFGVIFLLHSWQICIRV
jgi:hypothetical protein